MTQNKNKNTDYKSRKFLLCLLVLIIGTAGLFTGFLAGAEFVSLCVLSLTIYTGGNVLQKAKVHDDSA